MAATYNTKLSCDTKGVFTRDLGKLPNGKQQRFYLGKEKSQALIRKAKLEALWGLVSEGPRDLPWDALRLDMAKAVARGEEAFRLPQGSYDPSTYVAAVATLNKAYGSVIPVVAADAQTHGQALTKLRDGLGEYIEKHNRVVESSSTMYGLEPTTLQAYEPATLHEALGAYKAHLEGLATLKDVETRELTEWGNNQIQTVDRLIARHKDMPIGQIGIQEIRALCEYWRGRPNSGTYASKGEKPISRSTAKHHIWQLRDFFDWLDESKYKWHAPAKLHKIKLAVPKTASEKQEPVSSVQVQTWKPSELKTIFEHAYSGRERAFLLLGLNCGFAGGEFCSLTADQLFFEANHPVSLEKGDWLLRVRGKSGVYAQWKLWPETAAELKLALKTDKTLWPHKKPNKYAAALWTKLIARIRKTEKHKDFRWLSAKFLRKTSGNMIRAIAGGETQAMFHGRGKVVKSDNLAEIYSNKPWPTLHVATEKLRLQLADVLAIKCEADPKSRKGVTMEPRKAKAKKSPVAV